MAVSDLLKDKGPTSVRAGEARAARQARRESAGSSTLPIQQLKAMNDLDTAKQQLAQYEGSQPVRTLDPNRVRVSKYANRHISHFKSPEFARLRDDIALAGGNTVPVMVRPIQGDPDADFEIIYGHRRLQSCRDTDTPLLALISEKTDKELYALMVRENNTREDLSGYEEAVSYQKALDEGLYETQQALSAGIGVSQARISQVLSLLKVPATILGLFSSPVNVNYRWAMQILDAIKVDRALVMGVAKGLKDNAGNVSDKEILEKLLSKVRPTKTLVEVEGKTKATIVTDTSGVKVVFAKNVLPPDQTAALAKTIERFIVEAQAE